MRSCISKCISLSYSLPTVYIFVILLCGISTFTYAQEITPYVEPTVDSPKVDYFDECETSYFKHVKCKYIVKAVRFFADRGWKHEQLILAEFYYYGITGRVDQNFDHEEAKRWYLKAARQNQRLAQERLYSLFDYDESVDIESESSGVYWLIRSAENGYIAAQITLGDLYSKGEKVDKDLTQALYWYKKAAKTGNKWAQRKLATFHANKSSLKHDKDQAFHWYTLAAKQHSTAAQAALSWMHMFGDESRRDYQKAAEFAKKAANKNHPGAKFYLGYMYENGIGVKRNLDSARNWYLNASVAGYKGSEYAYKIVTAKMSDSARTQFYKIHVSDANAPLKKEAANGNSEI